MAGIARALQISELWVQQYVNQLASGWSGRCLCAQSPKAVGRCRWMNSDRLWIGKGTSSGCGSQLMLRRLRLSAVTSATVAWHRLKLCGNQCQESIANVPSSIVIYWSAYPIVLPSWRHRAVGKKAGLASYIERFNCTLRQRVSRLVRKTLSFSKKLENYIGAI